MWRILRFSMLLPIALFQAMRAGTCAVGMEILYYAASREDWLHPVAHWGLRVIGTCMAYAASKRVRDAMLRLAWTGRAEKVIPFPDNQP